MTGSRKSHDGGVPKPSRHVELYCDGACRGNPGPGGYGVILRCEGHEKMLSGAERRTTNNRMELSAAIAGLATLTEGCSVEVFTDSQYLKNGMTEWVRGWIAKGWKTAAKKPVLNQDLWKELLALCKMHEVRWHWVRGHSGHELNERCDRLANEAIDRFLATGVSRDASG